MEGPAGGLVSLLLKAGLPSSAGPASHDFLQLNHENLLGAEIAQSLWQICSVARYLHENIPDIQPQPPDLQSVAVAPCYVVWQDEVEWLHLE